MDFILWVVFWIGVNALIGYAIGKSKNDILGCVLLSVFLGPIGWLIALAAKGNVRKCPFCAEQIKPEAKVCRYCSREVPQTAAPKPTVPSVPNSLARDIAILVVIVVLFVLLGLMVWYAKSLSPR
jgi:hypothetical protein